MQFQSDREAESTQPPTPELADIEAAVVRMIREREILVGRVSALQTECNRVEELRRQESAARFQAQCAQTALEIHLARVCAELDMIKGQVPVVAQ
ncbi:MAG: hypothetical protein QM757_16460 [Paludibaculum sp.]